MATFSEVLTLLSSLVLRLSVYVFLRWIPGIFFPQLITATLIVYLTSFAFASNNTTLGNYVEEEVEKLGAKGDEDVQTRDAVKSREVEVDEAQSLEEQAPAVLKSLLLGLPHASSALWSLASLAINLSLAVMAYDLVYRAELFHPSSDVSFSRLGYVSHESAKILVREPDTSKLPIYTSYRVAPSSPSELSEWHSASPVYYLTNITDYTTTLTLSPLEPSTNYEYTLSSTPSTFTFTTAPPPSISPAPPFSFLTTSCIKPRIPYNPLQHPLAIPGLSTLAAKVLPSLPSPPSFMLFLGDFIYADVPTRFGLGASYYQRAWHQTYASPSWTDSIRSSLPWLHVYDDHEIANDWDQNTTAPYPAALVPYNTFHASVNPPSLVHGEHYTTFTHGPASFFLLDTRRFRDPSSAPSSPNKTMLGAAQLASVLAWLREPPSSAAVRFKILISSVPFTHNWRVNADDTWAGYEFERRKILEAMWDCMASDQGVGVLVLSGDRHEFAETRFEPPPSRKEWRQDAVPVEFSTSPLSMFYLPVRTYRGDGERGLGAKREDNEDEGRDVAVKYVPDGNSKVGYLEIEDGGEMAVVKFRLYVDGVEAWREVVVSPERRRGDGLLDGIWG